MQRLPSPVAMTSGAARLALLLLVGLGLDLGVAAEQAADINSLKAAFVYNFLKFAQWPADTFATAEAPLILCLGSVTPDLGATLGKLDGRRVQERPIAVRGLPSPARAGDCHLAYWGEGPADPGRVPGSVLTLGQAKDFLARGGMVGLGVEQERLVFDIDLEQLRRSGIQVSSQLLRLARNLRKD